MSVARSNAIASYTSFRRKIDYLIFYTFREFEYSTCSVTLELIETSAG